MDKIELIAKLRERAKAAYNPEVANAYLIALLYVHDYFNTQDEN